MYEGRTCSFVGCTRAYYARGLCAPHYKQKRKGQDLHPVCAKKQPNQFELDPDGATAWIILTGLDGRENGRARVEVADLDRVLALGRWHIINIKRSRTAYCGCIRRGGHECVLLHRFLLDAADSEVDHIDGNGLNNVKVNLRKVSRLQQMQNVRQTSRTGARNVYLRPDGSFMVQVHTQGRTIYGGLFRSLEEAESAAVALRAGAFTHHNEERC